MSSPVDDQPANRAVLGFFSSTAIVVASMIGTGVFTTTGFLIAGLSSPVLVLFMWGLGGFLALCGALVYGELSAAMPRSGGEYHFLGRIYHPLLGFLAGWISLIVGFSAPIAAAAIAFGKYTAAVLAFFPPLWGAILLVALLSVVHALNVRTGSYIQNAFTLLKVLLILVFIAAGFLNPAAGSLSSPRFHPSSVFSPAFAVGLIFVSFAYSGWNGATYIAGEVRRPEKTVPLALITGTVLVTILYVLLNLVFLRSVPGEELSGVVEVGHLVANRLFGSAVGNFFSLLIALALISSASAMIMTGPRVYQMIGEDYPVLGRLSIKRGVGGPIFAIALQAGVAMIMILTATFDMLLNFIGFTLSLSTGLAVAGVWVLRLREPSLARPYRVWGYPITPALYVLLSLWMVLHNFWIRPVESLMGTLTLGVGLALYYIIKR